MTCPQHSTTPELDPSDDSWVTPDDVAREVEMLNDPGYIASMGQWFFSRLYNRPDLGLTQTRARSRKRREGEHTEPPTNALRTPKEAAARLRCSIKTVHEHVASGRLGYVAIGSGRKRPRKMFTDQDLDAFIVNSTRKEVISCPSTKTRGRASTSSTSKSTVVAFSARRKGRTSAKPKP